MTCLSSAQHPGDTNRLHEGAGDGMFRAVEGGRALLNPPLLDVIFEGGLDRNKEKKSLW